MSEAHWLTIVGLGEDGPSGLSSASQEALAAAEVVMGAERHLALLPETGHERVVWPVPFADGLSVLKGLTGRRVVVLASGDPFWFGAGSVIAREFVPEEWRALPGRSVFSLVAARLGWPLEHVICLGLHAVSLTRLRPYLNAGQRLIVTLRDGASVRELARYLSGLEFGETRCYIMEALGGPRERLRAGRAKDIDFDDAVHPVVVALDLANAGQGLSKASGQPDRLFDTDGQITKRPVRALTLSALAPRPGELLWDIGAGSGSVGIEWLMAHPTCRAIAVEARADRAARVRANADQLGQDRIQVIEGEAPEVLQGLAPPDAVFLGGGLTVACLEWLWAALAPGTRIVANAVTLETTTVLTGAHANYGGDLLKVDLAEATPIGSFRGWKASYPVVQWSAVR